MPVRSLLEALALALALVVVATAPAGAARTLYHANDGSDDISVFRVGAGAGLTSLGSPVAAPDNPNPVVLTPDGRHLFTVGTTPATIRRYAVASDGTLSASGDVGTGPNTLGLAVSPDGTRLYSVGDEVRTYAIGGDGSLSPVGAPVATPASLGPVLTPDGTTLFVARLAGNRIDAFALGPDGAPTGAPVQTPTGGTLPVSLGITPDGRFLYATHFTSNDIAAFAIGAGGALTPVPGSPFPAAAVPFAATSSPDSRFLFVPAGAADTVQAYAIGANGAITPTGPPLPAGDNPVGAAVTPDGRSLFVSTVVSDAIARFTVASDGVIASAGPDTPTGGDNSDVLNVAISPNQGPTASFTATTQQPRPTQFDGRASSDPDGSVARYDWDMGDGTVKLDAGPTPEHGYARPGDYQVTLTVTDDEGCSVARVFTGRMAFCTPSGQARVTKTVTVPPLPPPRLGLNLSNVSADRYCIVQPGQTAQGAGTDMRVRYTLNDNARMTFSLQRRVTPRIRPARRCPVRTPGGPGRVPVQFGELGSTQLDGNAGENFAQADVNGRVVDARRRRATKAGTGGSPAPSARPARRTISTRRGRRAISLRQIVGNEPLEPGWYRILIQGVRPDDGSRSQAVAVKFWVLDVPDSRRRRR